MRYKNMGEMDRKLFDRRTLDRYVEKGLVKEGDLNAHLKGLPDDTNNAQWVEMELHEAEIIDDSENSDDSDSELEEDLAEEDT